MILSSVNWMRRRIRSMPELGTYAAIALALPGGSLIAFSLWAFRRRSRLAPHARRALVVVVALGAGVLVRSAS